MENVEDTLSINHNWLNSYNLGGCWRKLRSEAEVEKKLGGDVGASEGDFKLLEELLEARLEKGGMSRRDLDCVADVMEGMLLFGRGAKLKSLLERSNQ